MNKAFEDVMAERRRQVGTEGYSHDHDDDHADGELALAAALYAIPYQMPGLKQDDHIGLSMLLELGFDFKLKPEADYRKRLVKAAALLLAEIERLDRAALSSASAEAAPQADRSAMTTMEKIAADMRSGIFPRRSEV